MMFKVQMAKPDLIYSLNIDLILLIVLFPISRQYHILNLSILNLLIYEILNREQAVTSVQEHATIVHLDLWIGILR